MALELLIDGLNHDTILVLSIRDGLADVAEGATLQTSPVAGYLATPKPRNKHGIWAMGALETL